MAIQKKTPFWNAFPLTIEGLFDGVLLLKDPQDPPGFEQWNSSIVITCLIAWYPVLLDSSSSKIPPRLWCYMLIYLALWLYIYRSSFLQYFLSFLLGPRGCPAPLFFPFRLVGPRSCIVIRHWGPGEENRGDVEKTSTNYCWWLKSCLPVLKSHLFTTFFFSSQVVQDFLKHQQYDYYQWSWTSSYQKNPQNND